MLKKITFSLGMWGHSATFSAVLSEYAYRLLSFFVSNSLFLYFTIILHSQFYYFILGHYLNRYGLSASEICLRFIFFLFSCTGTDSQDIFFRFWITLLCICS